MYGQGAPPFRPPPGAFPPFAPGRPPPAGMPPFPPQNGSVRPPFSPNFTPGLSPNATGSSTPLPYRPSGDFAGVPPRPAHPGLGLPSLPTGMPSRPGQPSMSSPASNSPMPGFVREVKTTSVFLGGIAPGVTNQTLQDLLNACGPLHELKRVTGASGKPASLGFALFEKPEVVMRCVRCLNGVELPDLTPEGRQGGKPPKPLVVRVDEKTQAFLDEFEQTVGRSDDEESADAASRRAISHIVALLSDPNAPPPAEEETPRPKPPPGSVLPVHLQDLQEGDLPEEQRGQVLSQINAFREQSAKRERQKKLEEEGRERYRNLQTQHTPASSSQSLGRPPPAGPSARGPQPGPSRQPINGTPDQDQRRPYASSPGTNVQTPQRSDPQSYNRPVSFVPAQSAESKEQTERTDEEQEQIRRQRKVQDHNAALRERESKVEGRERYRIASAEKEMAYRRQQEELSQRNRERLVAVLADWNDEDKMERGKELFYADRPRWRAHRQGPRTREYQDDVRDRQIEEDEQKALDKESEDFLSKHMAEFSQMGGSTPQPARPTEGLAPIKLAIAPILGTNEEKSGDTVLPKRTGITFDAEDEDDARTQKKKRTLVKLEYEGEEIDEAEALVRRNARLLEIRKNVPTDMRGLRHARIEWAAINQRMIQEKIQPLIAVQITEDLGELDEDLADVALEQIRQRRTIDDVMDSLKFVLAEDTQRFAITLWRQVVFESDAFIQGIETGAMMAQA